MDLKITLFHQDVFTANSSTILDGTSGKVACNSYELYQKDIEALQILNVYLTNQKIESQSNDNLVLYYERCLIIGFLSRGREFCLTVLAE